MTTAKKKAVASRVNENVDMMLEANDMNEVASAYVRAMDALSNLHLALIKEQIEKAVRNKGTWIRTGQPHALGGTVIQCPFCDDKYAVEHVSAEHFCRNCGADLREETDDG